MRLTSATLTFVILPLLLLIAVVGVLGIQAVERQIEARMREDIEIIARAIEGPLNRSLGKGREGAMQQALDSAFAFGRVYGAHVYDERGELIAGAGAGGDAIPRGELGRLDGTNRTGRFIETSGEEVFAYFIPLGEPGGRFTALLRVSRRAGEFHDTIRRLNQVGLIVLLCVAAALGAVVFIGHRYAIGLPLRQLSDTMTRIAAGEADTRTQPRGPRELRSLTVTFNSMLDRLLASAREIVEHRRREASLEQRLETSRRLAAVGELAAGVAHELGTPLAVIDGRAQRLQRRGGTSRDDADAVREEVRRISAIVQELQHFARDVPLRRRETSVATLMHSTLERMEPVLRRSEANVRVLPPEPAELSVNADPDRLQQALVNLLRNAVQANEGGKAQVRLSATRAVDGAVIFRVEDNGPGVPAALTERVLEPFFTTKQVGEGMGLGLAIVHRVAEDHGGHVIIEQAAGGGASIAMRIPDAPGDGDVQ